MTFKSLTGGFALALGVAAISGVGSVSRALSDGLSLLAGLGVIVLLFEVGLPDGQRVAAYLMPGWRRGSSASARLRLLPSGSDRVRRLASRGARPSSLRTGSCLGPIGPRAGIQPR